MSNKQLRQILRIGHIVTGVLIIMFVYSTSLRESDVYTLLLQFVAIPAVSLSGIAMWQQARLSQWRRNRQQANKE